VPAMGCIDDGLGVDTCPHTPGQFLCFFQGTPLDCPPQWLNCLGTTCVEYFLKFQSLINPADQVIVPDFQIVGRTIYAAQLPGLTISELAQAAQGNFAATGFTNGPGTGMESIPEADHGDPVQLEIWSKATNRLVAIVGQYDSNLITLGDIDRGRFLALTPVTDEAGGLSEMRIASTYGRREPGDESRLPDADGDGRPDFFDRCKMVPDFGQRDADGDGFGNACDPDIDQDLLVTAADVAAIEACEGADLTVEQLVIEPLNGAYGLDGDEAEPPDPAEVLMAVQCRAMDLNGDLRVDPTDTGIATSMLGLPPGPSAFAASTSSCGTVCDDGVDCTHDFCDATTSQCVSVPSNCDDGDVCTVDTCDLIVGCQSAPLDCDDGNPCTEDRCDPTAGGCIHDPLPNGRSCDDEDLCTDGEFCDDGFCVGGTSTLCNDGDPCTLDACDPGTGQCVVSGSACDDGNDCTEDLCGAGGCQNVALNGDPCDDGDACTGDEICRIGECGGGAPVDCDDGDACTVDTCDALAGCSSAPIDCNDGNDCTEDLCDPARGHCINPPVTVGDPGPIFFMDQGTIQWPFTPGPKHWNLYRGTIPAEGMGSRPPGAEYDHVCFESADFLLDGATTTQDYMAPALGTAFYYAATEEVECVEGDPGADSAGVLRPLAFPCITPP
jgi:hypothetical protein